MRCSIRISKNDGEYIASLLAAKDSFSWNGEELLHTVTPLTKDRLIEVLSALGFHHRDILDAFDQADGKNLDIKHPLFTKR